MKKLRIFALVLVLAMVCPIFSACGSSDVQATVNVKFIVVDPETKAEEVILEKNNYTIICPKNELTALNAAIKVLNEYEVTFTSDANSITKVKDYANTTTPETYAESDKTHNAGDNTGKFIDDYWCLYINGQRNESGRMSQVMLFEGANVEFKFERVENFRQDTESEIDTSEDFATELETDLTDTEEPEDEE